MSHTDLIVLKQKAETTLININDWLTANKLLLNIPKTYYSIFTLPNKNIPNYWNIIKLGDTTIQRIGTSKYLRKLSLMTKHTYNN